MWQQVSDVYVADQYGLGMDAFFEGDNEFARQAMIGTMMVAVRHGFRDGSMDISDTAYEELMQMLISAYLESIAENGDMTAVTILVEIRHSIRSWQAVFRRWVLPSIRRLWMPIPKSGRRLLK